MKLLLYDKFWDAMLKLPKSIQKKVPEFIQKFRQDSRSSGIHLEPISTFKDPSLRTARIDQKYRAIIRVPDTGDTYFLLWIDNHDEAMNWAKDKVFEWNNQTQSYQIYSEPVFSQSEIKAPLESKVVQAPVAAVGAFNNLADEDLLNIGVPVVLLPSVRAIRHLADLELLETYLPSGVFEHLFYVMDGVDIRDILIDIKEGKIDSQDPDAQMLSANNRMSFFELTDDEQFNAILSGDLKKWKVYLHPSQRSLVESNFTSSVKVTGAAGTGKTVAAMHRAKYLSEHDLGRNGKPILFTTYTKSLTKNLAAELDGLQVNKSLVKVANIDSFAVEQAKELTLIPSDTKIVDLIHDLPYTLWNSVLDLELTRFDADFLDQEYQQVIVYHNLKSPEEYFQVSRIGRKGKISKKDKLEIWDLVKKYQELKAAKHYYYFDEIHNLLYDHYAQSENKPFGHIIADEIQDFSNVELRLLRSMVDVKPNDLFLVGDPLQKIYDQKINFSKAGIQIRGKRSRRLKINYRTSEEIKRAAVSLVKKETYDNFDGEAEKLNGYVSLFHGDQPEYLVFDTKDQELNHILSSIKAWTDTDTNEALSYDDICIACRTKDALKEIKSVLHNNKYVYYDITSGTGDTSGIHISTLHNMKGLEFKAVILADINDRTMPLINREKQARPTDLQLREKEERALMYVAMSRAIGRLLITGVGTKSALVGL